MASDGIQVTAVTDFSILIPTLLTEFRESLPVLRIDLDFGGYPLREKKTSESDARRDLS